MSSSVCARTVPSRWTCSSIFGYGVGIDVEATVSPVGKASDWLREERRKVLGDWVAVCLGCGAGRRWFEQYENEMPDTCATCGGVLLRRCPTCNAPFSSVGAVDFEDFGGQLRPRTVFAP